MEFIRKKKRGQNQKVRKSWFTEDGYRITWRKEVCGVEVIARYQACVRIVIPNYSGESGRSFEMWDFVVSQRLFKTRKKAEEACERHKRLWTKVCEASGIRELIDILGKLPHGIPIWAKKKLPSKIHSILTRPCNTKYKADLYESDLEDPIKTSDCSVSLTEVTKVDPIPVSVARDKDGQMIQPTDSLFPIVIPVKEPAKERKKSASKRTTKRSTPTSKKKRSTKSSPGAAKKRSKNLRKTKSKPSEN